MDQLSDLFSWFGGHESILSGIAAAVAIATLLVAPLRLGLRALARRTDGAPQPPAAPAPPDVLAHPAVAVLPFANQSGDPEQEYFADGITEDLITALSTWRSFPVIARNSSFAYKGRTVAVADVGRELGARYVLEGSVRKAAGRIRITARLCDASAGHELWSERQDRDLGDVFALQDEITRRIVEQIEPELALAEERRALRVRPDRLDGWDASLRALWHVRKGTREDYAEARRLLEDAVARDPRSCRVRSVLALCHFNEALLGWSADPPRALKSTLEAARAAVELDDRDWLAHALLGIALLWTERRYDEAIAEEARALSLNPSASISYQFLGCVLQFAGRSAEAVPHLETVLRLDPLYQSRGAVLADLALCHLLLRDLDQAVAVARRAVAEQPGNVRAHQRLVAALGHQEGGDEARAAALALRRLQPDFSLGYVDATYPFRDPQERRLFLTGLVKAGVDLPLPKSESDTEWVV